MQYGKTFTRRHFVGQAATALPLVTALSSLRAQETSVQPSAAVVQAGRKLRIGVVGLGDRGRWIAGLFKKHPGYEIAAVADYFDDTVQKVGEELGVPAAKRFSGLSGYKRVLDSGVEALVLECIPYFYREQTAAAIDADCHVYMAKPFAVDVPSVFAMGDLAKKAGEKKLCVRVDYQLPMDPANREVRKRIMEGGLGRLAHIQSGGSCAELPDPPVGKTLENLFRVAWYSHVTLSGDVPLLYDIHIIDGVTWVTGQRAVSACGCSRIVRATPHGNRLDCGGVVYQLPDGTCWTHMTQMLNNNAHMLNLAADLMGTEATAHLDYSQQVYVRGGGKHYSGRASPGIYQEGAEANIAEFYRTILAGEYDNATALRSVDSHLTAILGREAMARKTLLTMDELIKENKRLEADLRGLKG